MSPTKFSDIDFADSDLADTGFAAPRQRRERRFAVALAQLIATVALVVSIAIAAAAVSIGIARAELPPSAAGSLAATR